MTIKIIGYPTSPPALKVIATLNELGVTDYSFDPPENFLEIKSPKFLAEKNPFGKIPVLIDDGFTIYESRPMARYIVAKYQGKCNKKILYPDDIQKAAIVDQYISTESCYYDPPLYDILFQELFKGFGGGGGPDAEIVNAQHEKIAKILDIYERILEGKQFLTGSDITLADIFHYPTAAYTAKKHKDLWESRPNVKRWIDNIAKSEGVKKTFEDYPVLQF
ncbi:8154_t:CDS:2 [Diversispora eburnea]|uniref:glutathione transferase n=1 Tax=Diversispora eburnea TaxID=1213867 RepID=A0A9N9CET2_9GLOM|nr:8154_t:CDS:2 [Diversispora eburnea]